MAKRDVKKTESASIITKEEEPAPISIRVEPRNEKEHIVKIQIPPGPEMEATVRLIDELSPEKTTVLYGRALEAIGKSYQHWGLQADAARKADEAEAKARWRAR